VETGNAIRDKSYAFAILAIRAVQQLRKAEREFELSGQLVRSATSIGANVEEALAGQTRKDFTAKMAVASKEARESRYWLRLLTDVGLLDAKAASELLERSDELIRILTAIVKTSQSRPSGRTR